MLSTQSVSDGLFNALFTVIIDIKVCVLPPTKKKVHVFARVRLSVCLSVSKITQKHVHGFG